ALGICGDAARWLDFFFLIHAVLGLFFMRACLKSVGVSSWLGTAAALAFVLCGYNLIAGRGWYYMIPGIAWLPLAGLCLARAPEASRTGWALAAVASLGLGFHSGNVQMWLYTLLFLDAGLLLTWVLGNRATRERLS